MPLHEYLEQKRRQKIGELNASGACHICGSTCRNSRGFKHYFLNGDEHANVDGGGGIGDGAPSPRNATSSYSSSSAADGVAKGTTTESTSMMNYNENSMVRPPNLAAMRTCACFGIAPSDSGYWPYSVRSFLYFACAARAGTALAHVDPTFTPRHRIFFSTLSTCRVIHSSPASRTDKRRPPPPPSSPHLTPSIPPTRTCPASRVRSLHRGRQGHRTHTQLRHMRDRLLRRELRTGIARMHRFRRVEQRRMHRLSSHGGLLRDGHIQAQSRIASGEEGHRTSGRRPRGRLVRRASHHARLRTVHRSEHAVGAIRLRMSSISMRDETRPERRRRTQEVLHVR
jgi:hypothetical protein